MKKQIVKAKIVSNGEVEKDHFVIDLDAPYLAEHAARGQFVNVRVRSEGTDPLLRIPLGIHAVHEGGVKLLYKVVGEATRILSKRRSGEVLDVLGPLGNGFDLDVLKKTTQAILVAGGHGVAPLYGLADELIKRGNPVDFFIGASSEDLIVCDSELAGMGARVHIATEDGSAGSKCYVTEILARHCAGDTCNAGDAYIFACGPRPMLSALAGCSRDAGIPAQVSLDAYMACGTGACLGCAVETKSGYKLVCKDGPVFSSDEIVWEK